MTVMTLYVVVQEYLLRISNSHSCVFVLSANNSEDPNDDCFGLGLKGPKSRMAHQESILIRSKGSTRRLLEPHRRNCFRYSGIYSRFHNAQDQIM